MTCRSCLIALQVVSLANFVNGHSWVIFPPSRGGSIGSDIELQRYYCPTETLAGCQPEAKHGIVFTEENMRPCRAGKKSNPPQTINAGSSLRMGWAGNGHVNSQSDGTCILVQMAPYESDPAREAFKTLPGAECLPYYINGGQTTGSVSIPANTPNGEYTLFWLWDFSPFYFSSCMDIVVVGGSDSPPSEPQTPIEPAVPETPTEPAVPETPVEPATPSVTEAPTEPQGQSSSQDDRYKSMGCDVSGLGTNYCHNRFGTYCKSYQIDNCNRSVCHGDPHSSLNNC